MEILIALLLLYILEKRKTKTNPYNIRGTIKSQSTPYDVKNNFKNNTNDSVATRNIIELKESIEEPESLGDKNLVKILASMLAYLQMDMEHCAAFNILTLYRNLKESRYVDFQTYADCMSIIFSFEIDFQNIDINKLKEDLITKLNNYYKTLGMFNKDFQYNDTKFEYIRTESLHKLYSTLYNTYNDYYSLYYDDYNSIIHSNPTNQKQAQTDFATIDLAIQTIEIIINGYKILKYFNDNSDFTKVLNKLEEKNLHPRIIEEKMRDIFLEKIDKDFFDIGIWLEWNVNSENDKIRFFINYYESYKKFNSEFKTFTKDYEIYLKEFKKNKINLTKDITMFLLRITINKGYIEGDVRDYLQRNIIMLLYFLLKEELITYIQLNEFLINFDSYIEKIRKHLKNDYAKNEINRILDDNLEQEIIKSNECYNLDNINNGFEFENFMGDLFEKLGYKVKVTKKSGDQGADIIIENNDIKKVVQTKFYTHPVGNKAIQEITAAIAYYDADGGIVATNSTFTKSAIALADKNNIEYIDKYVLKEMIDTVSKIRE